MTTFTLTGQPFDRVSFDAVLRRRMFFVEAFEIYRKAAGFKGDNRGLYDYGPPGCALQANIVDLWRKHFVVEEDMLEVDCTVLTPEDIFKTSGHLDRFLDWMCKDTLKGDYLRADHLVEDVLRARLDVHRNAQGRQGDIGEATDNMAAEHPASSDTRPARLSDDDVTECEEILAQIDNYDGDGLGELIERFDIRNPTTHAKVSPPIPFNLMFKSTIGPSSSAPVYLRPETAQGQFLNFKRLVEYNQNIMPFASASVGKSYRNEISPRSGLLRVREFLMAEIEHFVDPEQGKRHSKFNEVKDVQLPLLNKATQLTGRTEPTMTSIQEAVKEQIIDNETLAYFLARIQIFLLRIGIDQKKVRFRQHLPNEMAHYASDCWDAELLTSHGWIECVGCADRSAYDLTVHMQRTKEKLVVREALAKPRTITEWQAIMNRQKLGKTFRGDTKAIEDAVTQLTQATLADLSKELAETGRISIHVAGLNNNEQTTVDLNKDLISIDLRDCIETTREYVPNVIEPSFGIGRILYCLLEHSYWHRPNDPARAVFSLPTSIAPTKILITPLSTNPSFQPLTHQISTRLRRLGITTRIDATGASIGKRYARNDELGTPFAITIDFDSLKSDPNTVTLRERDTTLQIRACVNDIITAVEDLVGGRKVWSDVRHELGGKFSLPGQNG